MAFSLPDLPFAFNALEPHIDAKTMEIHHGKHHATYVSKYTAATNASVAAGYVLPQEAAVLVAKAQAAPIP